MNSNRAAEQIEMSRKLDAIDRELRDLDYRMSLSHFNQLTGQQFEDLEPVNKAIADIMLAPDNIEMAARSSDVSDPALTRRLEIFQKHILNAHVTNNQKLFTKLQRLQTKIFEFQPVIDKKTVTRSARDQILETESDRMLRREAYFAGKALDDLIESDLLDLIADRNEVARSLNYPDYVAMGLESQDLTENELRQLFSSIRDQTDEAWSAVLKEMQNRLDISTVEPWDIAYYQNSILKSPDSSLFPRDKIVETFQKVLADVGGDLDQLPVQVVIQDIPYGGLCVPLSYNNDIRILANPRDGFQGYDVLFHEFGHGIQSACLNSKSHIVAGGDPPFFWEGIAGIYEHLMQSPVVLSKYFGLSPEAIEDVQRISRFFRMRWFRGIAVACLVEWDAYRGVKDLRGAMRRYHREYMGFDLPDSSGWAGNTLYTTHPLYNQNYVMMDVMALQVINAMIERFGHYPSEKMFSFVNETLIEPAGWIPWREKILTATGKSLSAESLSEYLKG